ncbi:unnamed protein product [Rotaria sp. Silwood1]|nr:unnamed protein product [Rotaria sp. Silwood1]CAF0744582.1 unnamed protein product [Rotaria sp. Silwood1]CAF0800578.1 unnamed protein product [Rotaria sp. Silwood1]CAF3334822.1 unnamed protein product [Rotaria sp. Silwood1]CAF3336537.1 unnamed protein product [Rotaria sp. Silwood1]
MPNDAIVPYEENPNHMIIWLDEHIGDPSRYQHLKKTFSTQMDPQCETTVDLVGADYAEILSVEGPLPIHFEGVHFLLAAFTNIESCINCFEHNQDKRIFFITSGSLGREAVPIVLERFKKTFTDPITDEPYTSIYVFSNNIADDRDWALDYCDYIQIFDFDANLLSRMVHDAGDYYFIEGKRLLDESPPNTAAAYYRLHWANILYKRYSQMENVSMKKKLDEVSQLLQTVEEESKSSSDEDD